MNLFKVEHIIYEYEDGLDEFSTENDTWSLNNSKIEFGITINYKHCLIYIDDEMYIDLDKMNLEIINLLKDNLKHKIEYEHIIFIAINEKTIIFIGDKDIVKEYETYNYFYNHKFKFSIKEYIIKKLLE